VLPINSTSIQSEQPTPKEAPLFDGCFCGRQRIMRTRLAADPKVPAAWLS
jgi:hypothetical protein